MKVYGDRNENGQTFFQMLTMENDCYLLDFKTADQIKNKSVLYQYCNNKNQPQQQNDNSIQYPKAEELTQITKDDQYFFSQFRNPSVNFSSELNVESVFPVTTSTGEVNFMIPQNNDVIFVNPEYIEQTNSEKYKIIYEKLIKSDQNIESDDYF